MYTVPIPYQKCIRPFVSDVVWLSHRRTASTLSFPLAEVARNPPPISSLSICKCRVFALHAKDIDAEDDKGWPTLCEEGPKANIYLSTRD